MAKGMLHMLMHGPAGKMAAGGEAGPMEEEKAMEDPMAGPHSAMADFVGAVHRHDHKAAHAHLKDWMDMHEDGKK